MNKISKGQISIIKELCDMCYFPTLSIRKEFFKAVCDSVKVKKLEEIDSKDFGTAFLVAEKMLHREGERVFSTKVSSDYKYLYNQFLRKA